MKATFSIRTLLIFTVIMAIFFAMLRSNHPIAALGFAMSAISLLLVLEAFHTTRNRINLVTRGVFAMVAIAIGWFSVVDLSLWFEHCEHCKEHRFVREYRLFGVPVRQFQGRNHADLVARIRVDLGLPCQHEYTRQHLVRAWGLVYRGRPNMGLTCCIPFTDPYLDHYYNEQVSQRARQYAQDNPTVALQLCEEIVRQEAYDKMHEFIKTLKQQEADWKGDEEDVEAVDLSNESASS